MLPKPAVKRIGLMTLTCAYSPEGDKRGLMRRVSHSVSETWDVSTSSTSRPPNPQYICVVSSGASLDQDAETPSLNSRVR